MSLGSAAITNKTFHYKTLRLKLLQEKDYIRQSTRVNFASYLAYLQLLGLMFEAGLQSSFFSTTIVLLESTRLQISCNQRSSNSCYSQNSQKRQNAISPRLVSWQLMQAFAHKKWYIANERALLKNSLSIISWCAGTRQDEQEGSRERRIGESRH